MKEDSSQIRMVEGPAVPLYGNDIDTDRIIPARFLRCVTFEGLGEQVFWDERFNEDGSTQAHPFNEPGSRNAAILIVNRNFGCGSSREHAPQALLRFGIRAIIGESFAEIFAGNCTNLGIPVFTADESTIGRLQKRVLAEPEIALQLDAEEKKVTIGGEVIQLAMHESARTALLAGTWDTLNELSRNEVAIEKVYDQLPYISGR